MLVLFYAYWPDIECFTLDRVWNTRYLPSCESRSILSLGTSEVLVSCWDQSFIIVTQSSALLAAFCNCLQCRTSDSYRFVTTGQSCADHQTLRPGVPLVTVEPLWRRSPDRRMLRSHKATCKIDSLWFCILWLHSGVLRWGCPAGEPNMMLVLLSANKLHKNNNVINISVTCAIL